MPRNVEIKARARDFEHQLGLAAALSGADSRQIDQVDTFYHCASGRLKLRRFADGSGELIQYHRADGTGARVADYLRYPVADPGALHATLVAALGVRGTVRKRRHLFRIGRTRVHADEVEGPDPEPRYTKARPSSSCPLSNRLAPTTTSPKPSPLTSPAADSASPKWASS